MAVILAIESHDPGTVTIAVTPALGHGIHRYSGRRPASRRILAR
jgi:hypothetical protein